LDVGTETNVELAKKGGAVDSCMNKLGAYKRLEKEYGSDDSHDY